MDYKSQSTYQGRNGSNACSIIALLIAKGIHKVNFDLYPSPMLPSLWVTLVCGCIRRSRNDSDSNRPLVYCYSVVLVLKVSYQYTWCFLFCAFWVWIYGNYICELRMKKWRCEWSSQLLTLLKHKWKQGLKLIQPCTWVQAMTFSIPGQCSNDQLSWLPSWELIILLLVSTWNNFIFE